MSKVSTFSRTVDNFAKKGQYFTCPRHSKAIGKLLDWPEEEVSVLEPSIGDASALFSFLDQRENRVIFGVELDNAIAQEHEKSKQVDYLLNADFLSGISISNNAFSLCFANPPYGDSGYNERMESLFMKRISSYMKTSGLIVLIIPWYIFRDDPKFALKFTNRFETEAVYKFHEREFAKYQQIVLIGRKKRVLSEDIAAAEALSEMVLDINAMSLLPMTDDEVRRKIRVYPSSSKNITLFQTLKVNEKELEESFKKGNLYSRVNLLKKVVEQRVLRPPIPPKSGHLYLLGTTGFTSGLIGSEEHKDVHLQRGKVKDTTIVTTATDDNNRLIETTKTVKTTSMVIIDANGSIIRF